MNLTALFIAIAPSAATPVFSAAHEADEERANEAWQAARECTGRDAQAHALVRIERSGLPGGYLGRAERDEDGLHTITLDPDTDRVDAVLVHEIAHAWIHGGPPTLREGRTELLADCIVRTKPGLAPLQWDDSRTLNALPDLRTWSDRSDHGPAMLAHARTDAYLGSARLIRAAARTTPESELLTDPALTWDAFNQLMERSAQGRTLLEALEGGAASQREALADEDLDGVSRLIEAWQGTSDRHWDTNQDGWWDGAQAPPDGAVALPLDQSPVCGGLRTGDARTQVRLEQGGNLRGIDPPTVQIIHGEQTSDLDWTLPPLQPVVMRLNGTSVHSGGGAWAQASGELVQDSKGCLDDPTQTIWATDSRWSPALPEVWDTATSLRVAADEKWGPIPQRLVIALGGPKTHIDELAVWLGDEDLNHAINRGELTALIKRAVAWSRIQGLGHGDWRAAASIANMLDDTHDQDGS